MISGDISHYHPWHPEIGTHVLFVTSDSETGAVAELEDR